ncbi:MAG TPA: helix-turn-helix transcriptional regulator [Longimicrobiaceae bacterium]|nr:helix-turn-helix transcriptional regulator [Longimicrobiaceae bacterium]
MNELGDYLRGRRLARYETDPAYSVNRVAGRVGVTPSYLSQVERGLTRSPPSEETLVALADDLGVDRDLVLALAGKIASDLRQTITRRPTLFAELLRELRDAPDHAVLRLVREVRDGDW